MVEAHKHVENLDERKISWRSFERYFKHDHMSQQYYDKKMQELFELKLGNMTMEEYESILLELLNYVGFIQDEKVKS